MKSKIKALNSEAAHIHINEGVLELDLIISTNYFGVKEIELFYSNKSHKLCFERNTYEKVNVPILDYTLSEKISSIKCDNSAVTNFIINEHRISKYKLLITIKDCKNVISISVENMMLYLQIEISGECEVLLNSEPYKYISPLSSIKSNFSEELFQCIREYEEYINIIDSKYEIDLRVDNNHVVTAYMDKNSTKENSKVFLRYDSIKEDYTLDDSGYILSENFSNINNSIENNIKNSYINALKDIKKLGFDTAYSHDQSPYDAWGWTDVIIELSDFNKKNLLDISEIMFKHEDVVKKYL